MNANNRQWNKYSNANDYSNKENAGTKIYRNIPSTDKHYGYSNQKKVNQVHKGSKLNKWNTQSGVLNAKHQNCNSVENCPKSPKEVLLRNASKGNITNSKPGKMLREIVKFPKIKEQRNNGKMRTTKQSRSVKKLLTQPEDDDRQRHILTATLSPNNNSMKQMLLGIMKNKENRHLMSIDEQIDKLEILTKRYSCLRQDLVSIQQDILTISLKEKQKDRHQNSSQTVSRIYL